VSIHPRKLRKNTFLLHMLGLSLMSVYLNVGLLARGRASYKDDQGFRWFFSVLEQTLCW